MKRVYRAGTLVLVAAGTGVIFYLSWLPDPMLSKYNILPEAIARWSDQPVNENRRTAVPFTTLGMLISTYLLFNQTAWRWWLYSWLGLTGIVIAAEAGQLILPQRSFDWSDIAWGTVGSLIGLLPAALLRFYRSFSTGQLRRRNNRFFY